MSVVPTATRDIADPRDLQRKRKREDLELLDMAASVVQSYRRLLAEMGGLDAAMERSLLDFAKNSFLQLTDSAPTQAIWNIVSRARKLGHNVSMAHRDELEEDAEKAYRKRYHHCPTSTHTDESGDLRWEYTEQECTDCIDDVIQQFYSDY